LTVCSFFSKKSSKTFLARADVTLQVAVIIPEQPSSKPFNNLDSEPGKIEKLSISRFSKRL